MSVTVKDIADRANVSTATVSRALNPEQTGIKPEVRNEIVALAERMGYKKKGRKASKTDSGYVGIIYKREPTSFVNGGVLGDRLYQAIEVALYNQGKQALMHNIALDDAAPDFLKDGLVSGVLLVELDIDNDHKLLKELKQLKIPAVAVNHPGYLDKFDVVSVNYVQCFQLLTKRLLAKGCQKIAFASNDFGHYVTRNSFLGYGLAMYEVGKTPQETFWLKEKDSLDVGRQIARDIVADGSIDGVVCMSNQIAGNLINELNNLGKRVPQDIRVCGFDPQSIDDTEVTSGVYDLPEMTTRAVELLAYRSHQTKIQPVKVTTYCRIQEGRSD
ncbi:LacI family DNA-binding transcriptional regulator [Lentisphaera profundi]|uniref:LacI family DNA-binding transcriptional regulator n=1 Tax=Lentisphaera profundi TaxID=1658616 RepID=A0ABY7VY39_9BACT|nr:LacI family DNA-binding transcriptional regulator [Lentisphaera profundi]WDE99002.1 LacI family DNA-binding transcriptional regulator [Lentisphaera profundi]